MTASVHMVPHDWIQQRCPFLQSLSYRQLLTQYERLYPSVAGHLPVWSTKQHT